MGSIVATVGFPPDPQLGERMLGSAPYRGTCRQCVAVGRCLLGFSRTEDGSDAGSATRDGWGAVFCGTLDNLAELAAEPGDRVATPAEAVLATFQRFGKDAPARLRGAFAAAVTDGRQLWCFRDHVGLYTLVYSERAGTVAVASEPAELEPVLPTGLQPDLDGLEALLYKFCDGSAGTHLGVRTLPAATTLCADGSSVRLHRYWRPEHLIESARLADDEIAERFAACMSQAVARTLTGADAIALSGGIDSTAVAAFAAPLHRARWGRPLGAVSAVYPQHPTADESEFIRAMASSAGLVLHTYVPAARPTDHLEYWTRLTRSPVHPQYTISETEEMYRCARALGYRTVITGEYAEGLVEMRQGLFRHLLRRGRIRTLARHLRGYRANGVGLGSLAGHLAVAAFPRLYAAYRRVRGGPRVRAPDWLDADRVRQARRTVEATRPTWRHAQMPAFEGANLAGCADEVCQEVCGVRVRVPWADVDLWEFFMSLPAEVKFPDVRPKGLVRSLLRGRVPDTILDRSDKTYFDDAIRDNIDYKALRRWLVEPKHRLRSIDYEVLAYRLHMEDLELSEFLWAKDLASIQAFLALW
ncbi:MAG: asparagine synthase-related protein [Armatimonadota bacterium]|nr:asparagine synthase-related protein [Armatimonadota bacterium]